jgi:polar amino acid transport system substrate-binding protein
MKVIFFIILFLLNLFANELKTTKNEDLFIKSHTFKCITTTNWAPFNSEINGKLVGISVDFWNIIKKRLNLKTKCIIAKNWSEVLNAIKNKKADITLGTGLSPTEYNFAIFSKPYATFPIVIATKNNVGFIASLKYLKDKKIAVGKNYTVAKLIKKNYPNFKLIEVNSTKEALKLVSNDKAFAAIDIMPVIVYNINKYEFSNLKISGKTSWNFKLRFMLSKNNTPLLNAINKAIDTITLQEKEQIYKKWMVLKHYANYNQKNLLKIISIFSAVIVILVAFIYFLLQELKKRKKLEAELTKLTYYDALTNIYNRYKINKLLSKNISYTKRHQTPLSIIFFDIDFFKLVNDNYGHEMGDKILKEVAELISNNLRKYDLLGRWGGEEFIIILPNTDIKNALKVAQKLKKEVENFNFSHNETLTCSFGVTQFQTDDDIKSLLKRADTFLYKAKKNGRNRIFSDLDKS